MTMISTNPSAISASRIRKPISSRPPASNSTIGITVPVAHNDHTGKKVPANGRKYLRVVDRKPGRAGSGVRTGLSFRVKDTNNYFFAYTSGRQISPATVGYYFEGLKTTIASQLPMPATWTRLTVVTLSSGSFKVFAGSTVVFSGTELVLSRETKAGLYSNDRGMGLVNRWDNFAVFNVN